PMSLHPDALDSFPTSGISLRLIDLLTPLSPSALLISRIGYSIGISFRPSSANSDASDAPFHHLSIIPQATHTHLPMPPKHQTRGILMMIGKMTPCLVLYLGETSCAWKITTQSSIPLIPHTSARNGMCRPGL